MLTWLDEFHLLREVPRSVKVLLFIDSALADLRLH